VLQHQSLFNAAAKRKHAITQQFDLLIAAIEAKRDEFIDASNAEFQTLAGGIARDLLESEENIQMMSAALVHLRSAEILTGMQIAAIVNALDSSQDTAAAAFQRPTFHAPEPMGPNLEGIMSIVQRLTPNGREATAPFTPKQASPNRVMSPAARRLENGALTMNSRSPEKTPAAKRATARGDFSSLKRNDFPRKKDLHTTSIVAEPGSNGTCLFNVALHDMLDCNSCVIQWVLKVDDPGDWVGVGVGVGGTLDSWANGTSFDLMHLWIVPQRSPKLLVLRVERDGVHAKLRVFDRRGKRLDDNRIPHWNATRPAYPQVSFGGRNGRVVMLQGPHRIAEENC
jgi:hypothetical protein